MAKQRRKGFLTIAETAEIYGDIVGPNDPELPCLAVDDIIQKISKQPREDDQCGEEFEE